MFNATATLTDSGNAIELAAAIPQGWKVRASSYGRASWPMTIFFSKAGVPVLPWFSELNETKPWVIPPFATQGHNRISPSPLYVANMWRNL